MEQISPQTDTPSEPPINKQVKGFVDRVNRRLRKDDQAAPELEANTDRVAELLGWLALAREIHDSDESFEQAGYHIEVARLHLIEGKKPGVIARSDAARALGIETPDRSITRTQNFLVELLRRKSQTRGFSEELLTRYELADTLEDLYGRDLVEKNMFIGMSLLFEQKQVPDTASNDTKRIAAKLVSQAQYDLRVKLNASGRHIATLFPEATIGINYANLIVGGNRDGHPTRSFSELVALRSADFEDKADVLQTIGSQIAIALDRLYAPQTRA